MLDMGLGRSVLSLSAEKNFGLFNEAVDIVLVRWDRDVFSGVVNVKFLHGGDRRVLNRFSPGAY